MSLFNNQFKLHTEILLRLFDIFIALFGLFVSSPITLCVLILGFFDTGSPMFRQERVGKNKNKFILYKFRTMTVDTKSVASHLAHRSSITRFGSILRKTKLDELPQLVNVLKGEMSVVGPRPCLFNQKELIVERERLGVFEVLPGITGLAQIKGVDMSTPLVLAKLDKEMIDNMSVTNYLRCAVVTILGRGYGDKVT